MCLCILRLRILRFCVLTFKHFHYHLQENPAQVLRFVRIMNRCADGSQTMGLLFITYIGTVFSITVQEIKLNCTVLLADIADII